MSKTALERTEVDERAASVGELRTVPPLRRPIRVLQIASTLHIGGAERVLACLGEHLDRTRFEVTAVYLKENGVVGKQMLAAGVDLIGLPGHVPKKRDYFSSLKLLRLIRERQIDVIHTHDLHGFMDAAVCRLLRPRLRFVHTFHFGNYPHREAHYRRIERLLWRVPDALVAVGHTQAGTIRDLYRIPAERLLVLWNGVDLPAPQIADEVRRVAERADGPLIASISTMIPQKGLHFLLDAASLLQKRGLRFHLMIVGQGKLRQELESQCDALGLRANVSFLGWVPEGARRALPACDIFVQSSLWEAMSVAVLEAMAAGKPSVITRVGDNAHVIEDEVTGLTVAAGDPAALAAALERLLADAGLRQTLGKQAETRYRERFTVKHMVNEYENLYMDLVSGRQAATTA